MWWRLVPILSADELPMTKPLWGYTWKIILYFLLFFCNNSSAKLDCVRKVITVFLTLGTRLSKPWKRAKLAKFMLVVMRYQLNQSYYTGGLKTNFEAETNTSFILIIKYMWILINKENMSLVLLLCSFSQVRSPCQFSGTLYSRSMSTAHAYPFKNPGDRDDDERNYIFNAVHSRFALMCS